MEGWEKTEHDFGVVKAGEELTFEFVFRGGNGKLISRLVPSCGCTTIELNSDGFTATYTPGDIPKAAEKRGYYFSNKFIKVIYDDRTEEHLFLKARVEA